ncbi:hypothetical protein LguiA_009951 [Lonicera macranthoides]
MESPDFYIGSYFNADDDNQHSHNSLDFHQNNNNHFTVDDLLDFSKGDAIIAAFFFYDHSSLPSVHISNSSSSGNESQPINSCSSFTDAPFSGNEYNELPKLEWISNFENESFSNAELQNFQFISSTATPSDTSSSQSAEEFGPKLASGPQNGQYPVRVRAQGITNGIRADPTEYGVPTRASVPLRVEDPCQEQSCEDEWDHVAQSRQYPARVGARGVTQPLMTGLPVSSLLTTHPPQKPAMALTPKRCRFPHVRPRVLFPVQADLGSAVLVTSDVSNSVCRSSLYLYLC